MARYRITIEYEVVDEFQLAAAVIPVAVGPNRAFQDLEEWRDYRADEPVMADLKEWLPGPADGVSQEMIDCVRIDNHGSIITGGV